MAYWIETSSPGSVYWMSGVAGTGKTTIAYSLCEELNTSYRLAASFFCSRLLPECRDANRTILSIAYQLALSSPPLRFELLRVLEKDPTTPTGLPLAQFDTLLAQPLIEVKDKLPNNLIVIIDALDECDDKANACRVLDALVMRSANLPINFIVSSRPEPEIRNSIVQAGSRVVLYDLGGRAVQAGIKIHQQSSGGGQSQGTSKAMIGSELGAEPSGPSGSGGYDNKASNKASDRSGSTSRQVIEPQIITQERQPSRGLNILCIEKDGGGVRGLSSLLLLREVMHRLSKLEGIEQLPGPLKPSGWFDVIAGTGTGGFSACTLGKLGMSVDEAIGSYKRLMTAVSSSKNNVFVHGAGSYAYDGAALRESLRSIIRDSTGYGDKKMTDETPTSRSKKCNTIVFAMRKHYLTAGTSVMFRSYRDRSNSAPDCAMWEALYATMAHPDFFKSIDITENSVKQSFVGGELGCSNPLAHVPAEVRDLYHGQHVSCVLSIGAGHARIINIPSSGRSRTVGEALQKMITDSERVAEETERRFQDTTGV
ncbi:hypothetical protein FRC11_005493 [Ceratobasidium sp. 423]|nr:hypothetical protein FRC11_005493 [Ceratobasidium sp. 423]